MAHRQTRLAIFALLCWRHAHRRAAAPEVMRSEHRLDARRFLQLAVKQFARDGSFRLELARQPLLSLPYAVDLPAYDQARVWKQPLAHLRLFLANGLKLEGFYADAEHLYRRIAARHPAVADLALTNIADIYFTQAQWAREFRAYASDNIAINPLADLPAPPRAKTWHRRTFAEAAQLLRQALACNPYNRDAAWILVNIAEVEGRWADGLAEAGRYVRFAGASAETMFHRARSVFHADPVEGAKLYALATGPDWRTTARRLVGSRDLQDDRHLLRWRLCEPACRLNIRTHVFTRGESFDLNHPVNFDRRYLSEFADVEILPRFGMLLVGKRWLLTDTAHVKRVHWPVFTSGFIALTPENALLCTAPARKGPCDAAIYIGHNNNYFHWIVEELPRLKSILDDPEYARLPVLVAADAAPWQITLLERLGVARDRIAYADFSAPLQMDRLVSPARLAKDLVVHPEAVRFLRDRLTPNHAALKPRRGKRLYLLRGDATGRAMLNEPEIVELFLAQGFEAIDPGRMSLDQQMAVFADAEVIAGPGGAALTNILFAPRDVKIIALASDDILTETFSSIAAALGQEYWLCLGPSFPRAHRYWIWTRFNFVLDPTDVKACIADVLASVSGTRVASFGEPSYAGGIA